MKINILRPLSLEDIQPYLIGCNALLYTNHNGEIPDTSIGEIKQIKTECVEHLDTISTITISLKWLTRVRDTANLSASNGSHSWQILEKTLVTDYELRFESPLLEKVRSPLIFRNEDEVIEISHVTNLARSALEIKARLGLVD